MYEELKKLVEAFPADLDWDSNTEPFFNGPSGESLGGGATGFYSVYGKPFRLEGEDYDYDGPTYVEACNADFAKFMVAARDGVLALIAENEKLTAIAYGVHGAFRMETMQERDQLKAAISTPETVFLNMKAGGIPKPTLRSMVDLYGEVVNGEELQLLEIAKLRAESEELRKDAERFRFIQHDADSGMRRIYGDDWLAVVDAGGFQ